MFRLYTLPINCRANSTAIPCSHSGLLLKFTRRVRLRTSPQHHAHLHLLISCSSLCCWLVSFRPSASLSSSARTSSRVSKRPSFFFFFSSSFFSDGKSWRPWALQAGCSLAKKTFSKSFSYMVLIMLYWEYSGAAGV